LCKTAGAGLQIIPVGETTTDRESHKDKKTIGQKKSDEVITTLKKNL